MTSAPNADSATALLRKIRQLLNEDGFKITKWTTNSRQVIERIPLFYPSKELKNLCLTKNPLPKEQLLGLYWDVEADTLCFKVQINQYANQFTRRVILSVINSVYDSLGFEAPAFQPMKTMMQDLCRKKLDWDQEIPSENKRLWMEWLQQLSLLASFQVPLCVEPAGFGKFKTSRIHHFSDASERSYGYAAYFRAVNQNNQMHCSLMGKTALTTFKTFTISRLELCAATIASRQDQYLRRELQLPCEIQPSIFWTKQDLHV